MNYSVKVIKTERNHNPRIKGYATVILNNSFILKNIRLMQRREGTMYLVMPAWVNKNEHNKVILKDKYNPISNDFRVSITEAAVKAYETGEVVKGQTATGDDMPVEVSVKLVTRDRGNIKAMASLVLDNSISVKGIRYCVDKNRGHFLGYPSNLINNPENTDKKNKYVSVCHPITKDFADAILSAIAGTYSELSKESESQKESEVAAQ